MSVPPLHRPGGFRELLVIALPLMMSAGMQSIMHVIDRIYLTWYSSDALAASLPAGILYWSCLSFPFGVGSYINTFVAQYDGAKQPERVLASVWQGVCFAFIAGTLITLLAPLSGELFQLIGHPTKVAELETIYFRWLCWGSIPAVLQSVLSAYFSGRGQTRIVLYVNAGCVGINAFLDYAFIYGWGFIPEFGMAGAAMTDIFGNVLATVIFSVLILRNERRIGGSLRTAARFDRGLFADLLRFGGPSGLQMLIDVAGFAVFMMLVGRISQDALAATNLAFNLNTVAFIPVVGLGIAVSTLVGQRIGEGKPELAAESTWRGVIVGCGYMLLCGLLFVTLPDLLIRPYALFADPKEFAPTHSTVVVLLRFVAIYSFFDAMAIIFGSSIRGAGDTRFSMIFGFLSAWGLLVIPTALSWWWPGPNLYVCWSICSVYVVALGFGYGARFLQGRWKTMNVIHRGEPPAVTQTCEPAPLTAVT